MSADTEETSLTLKSLQSHLIKTLVACVGSSLLIVLASGFAFYYNTQNTLDKHDTQINELNMEVDKHGDLISNNSNDNNISETEMKNLDKRMSSIEENQKEIFNLLIEISSDQKAMIRNSGN